MLNVEPVAAPLVAEVRLALRYFVCVMRENVVNAAAMYIEALAEVFERNARALDVPAGISEAPRAFLFELLVLELGLGEPKDEVGLVPL